MSIEGPSKVDINCEDVEDGTCRVTYCPTEPGSYTVNIKFAEKHIPGKKPLLGVFTNTNIFDILNGIKSVCVSVLPPGSPFTVKVTGEGRIKESITRKRQASSIASVGSTCGLNLKIPGEYRIQSEVVKGQPVSHLEIKDVHLHWYSLPFHCCRKLVSDGFSSGEAYKNIHPQQPYLHPH